MKIRALLLASLLAISLLGCTVGSGTMVNAVELNSTTKMSMTYDKFSGYKQTEVTVKDQPVEVSVNIVTESGSIDAYIARDNDISNAAYEGRDIETSSFTVTLSEPGNYTIRVDAKNHKGSYSFSWGK